MSDTIYKINTDCFLISPQIKCCFVEKVTQTLNGGLTWEILLMAFVFPPLKDSLVIHFPLELQQMIAVWFLFCLISVKLPVYPAVIVLS